MLHILSSFCYSPPETREMATTQTTEWRKKLSSLSVWMQRDKNKGLDPLVCTASSTTNRTSLPPVAVRLDAERRGAGEAFRGLFHPWKQLREKREEVGRKAVVRGKRWHQLYSMASIFGLEIRDVLCSNL